MMWRAFGLVVPLLLVVPPAVAPQGTTLTAAQAIDHVGETATVCGIVASATHPAHVRGEPTFLNLDKPRPDQIFTIVIWGSDREKFGQPEVTYRGQKICVSGKIERYRGVPRIVAQDPKQIAVEVPRVRNPASDSPCSYLTDLSCPR